jgi:hypothetical protein
MKRKGCFETVSDIQRESQAILDDSIKENDFYGAFYSVEKNNRITVYIPKETILKEMAVKIKLNQHFFFVLVRELSNRTLYCIPLLQALPTHSTHQLFHQNNNILSPLTSTFILFSSKLHTYFVPFFTSVLLVACVLG